MKLKNLDEHPVYAALEDKKIIIVMPVYNSTYTLRKTISRIPRKFMDSLYKLIIVNDGSVDNSLEVIKELLAKNEKIILINHETNKGYGAAQKTGFKSALEYEADIVVLLHSDGQYAPEILPKMIAPFFGEQADMVLGSRILGGMALEGGMPLYKYWGNKFLTFIENLAYGMHVSEYHTGYMLYSRNALERISFERLSNTFHFDGEAVMMSGKKKLKLVEVPIPTTYAKEKSHLKPIRYGLDVLNIIFREKCGKYNF